MKIVYQYHSCWLWYLRCKNGFLLISYLPLNTRVVRVGVLQPQGLYSSISPVLFHIAWVIWKRHPLCLLLGKWCAMAGISPKTNIIKSKPEPYLSTEISWNVAFGRLQQLYILEKREKHVYLLLHELDYNHTRCEIQNTGQFKQAYKLHYVQNNKHQPCHHNTQFTWNSMTQQPYNITEITNINTKNRTKLLPKTCPRGIKELPYLLVRYLAKGYRLNPGLES